MGSGLINDLRSSRAPLPTSGGCSAPRPWRRPPPRVRTTVPVTCRKRLLDTPAIPRRPPPAPQHRDDSTANDHDEGLLCALCRHPVTHPRERTVRSGAHEHGRINPAGFSFHLACFAAAPGATAVGPATLEHSWFAGYGWRIALCGGCGEQLGWRFEAPDGDRFFGLIVGRLVAGQPPRP